MMHGKDHAISLTQRHDLGTRLHARPLLGQHELAAREIQPRRGEQEGGLQREHMLSIEILMQAVVVALAVLQQERSWPRLTGAMATVEESGMFVGIAHVDTQGLVPSVRN